MNLFSNKKVLSVTALSGVGIFGTVALYSEQPGLQQSIETPVSQGNSKVVFERESNNSNINYDANSSRHFKEMNLDDYMNTTHAKKTFLKWAKTSDEVKKEYIDSPQYKKDLASFKNKLNKDNWLTSQFAKPFVDKYIKTSDGLKQTFAEFLKTKTFDDWGQIWADANNDLTKKEWFDNNEVAKTYFQAFKDNLVKEDNEYFQKFMDHKSLEYNYITKQYSNGNKPKIGYEDMLKKWKDKAIPSSKAEWKKANEGLLFYQKWLLEKEDEFKEEWKNTTDYFVKLQKYLENETFKNIPSLDDWKQSSLVKPYYNKWRFSKAGLKTLKDKWVAAKKPNASDQESIKAPKIRSHEYWLKYFAIDSGGSYEKFGGTSYQDWISQKANNQDLYAEFKKTQLFKDRKSIDDNYDKSGTKVLTYPETTWSILYADFKGWLLTNQKAKETYLKSDEIKENFNFLNWSWMTNNGIDEYSKAKDGRTSIITRDYNDWKNKQVFTKEKYDQNHLQAFEKDFKEWLHKNNWKQEIYFNSSDANEDYENWSKNILSQRNEQTYQDLLKYEWSTPYLDYINFIKKTLGGKYLNFTKDQLLYDLFYNSAESDFLYRKWKDDYRRSANLDYVDGYKVNKQSNKDYQKWLAIQYGKTAEANTQFNTYNSATLDEESYKNNAFAIFENNFAKWLETFQDYDKFSKMYQEKKQSEEDLGLYKWENDLGRNDFSDELTIFHTNDTHAYVTENRYAGMGFAKISTIVKNARKNDPSKNKDSVLLLDGGDFIGGQVYATLTKGAGVIPVLNEVGYDAMALGNHEFDFGSEVLKELMEKSNFPYLSANTTVKDKSMDFPDYKIFNKNGVKVGVFGLTTPETTSTAHPSKITNFAFEDPISNAKRVVAELKAKNVDLIVALGHMGDDENAKGADGKKSEASRSSEIVKAVPEIDVFIDGHTHQLLKKPYKIGKTLILQVGDKTKNVGKLRIKIGKDKKVYATYEIITKAMTTNVKKDQKVLDIIKHYNDKIEIIKKEVITKNPYPTMIRYGAWGSNYGIGQNEMQIGNLVAEAMLEDAPDADFALQNAGGIRASLYGTATNAKTTKEITKGDIISILPFGNIVSTMELTGAELKAAIEHGVKNYPKYGGYFPHIAGFKVELRNKKVVKMTKNDGTPIVDDTVYKLATNDFVAAGGDYYAMFKGKKVKTTNPLDEALINYIKKYAVAFKTDGSIDRTKANWYTKTAVSERIKHV